MADSFGKSFQNKLIWLYSNDWNQVSVRGLRLIDPTKGQTSGPHAVLHFAHLLFF